MSSTWKILRSIVVNIRRRGYRRLEARFEFDLHRDVYMGRSNWKYSYQAFRRLNIIHTNRRLSP